MAAAAERVYVGNLAWSVTDQSLAAHMASAGEVVSATVLKRYDGRSKGSGIVEFASADAAKKAIETLNETALEGRNVFVREDRGGASTERPTGTSLYVGNLPFSVGWGELKDLFAPYNVVRADVKMDHRTHRSRGFGIVLVATAEDAQKAIDALNEYEWEGRNIVVRMDQPRA